MKQLVTKAIILARTDYGEADRIITLLSQEHGKIRVVAKGVRRVKSKLAGGIELFSVSTITYIQGRSELGTLVSTQLQKHYGRIVGDIERTMVGYDIIKKLHTNTEDNADPEYFELLERCFEALNQSDIPINLVEFWFTTQMLRLNGNTPNLETDTDGRKLVVDQRYDFDKEHMTFVADPLDGSFDANHIKFLRLVFSGNTPEVLRHIQGIGPLLNDTCALFV